MRTKARGLSAWAVAVIGFSVTSAASASPTESRRARDASVDRNILMPAAETIGAGEFTFNSYELLLAGVTYGVTDDIAVSVTGLLPVLEDLPRYVSVTGKFRLLAGSNDIFSLQPSVMHFAVDGGSASLFGVNALYDHVFDAEGRHTFTLAATALTVPGADGGDVDLPDGGLLAVSGAFNVQPASHVKCLAEFYLPAAIGGGESDFVEQALLLNYGIRFFGRHIAVDLTFLRPIHPDAETPFVLGLPFVVFSARL